MLSTLVVKTTALIVMAVVLGALTAIFKWIADVLTITDFETVNGPILYISKEDIGKDRVQIDNNRNRLLSVKYVSKTGDHSLAYFKVPANLAGITDSSKKAIICKTARRASIGFKQMLDYQIH